jgi:hypothetical protein
MGIARLLPVTAVAFWSLLASSCVLPMSYVALSIAERREEENEAADEGPPRVSQIAYQIDRLEKHIDRYGSIVPKHADVWGQARLMMHRQEYELQMKQEIGNFHDTLQASLARSDQAFLASAFALQAAVSGGTAPAFVPTSGTTSHDTTITNNIPSTAGGPSSTTTQKAIETASLGQPSAPDVEKLITEPDKGIFRTAPRATREFKEAPTPKTLALEPTLHLDQESRFIKHLHELRRVNEGDDNTDAAGYALNLIRLPVSILTGSCTEAGYGAECTATISPYLTDDLLPTTFRNLVIKDLIDQFTLPVTQLLDTLDPEKDLKPLVQSRAKAVMATKPQGENQKAPEPSKMIPILNSPRKHTSRLITTTRTVSNPAGSSQRVKQLPVPPSQLLAVYGEAQVTDIVRECYAGVKDHLINKRTPYHLDVRSVLTEELKGAYNFLSTDINAPLWQYVNPALVQAIRTRNTQYLDSVRQAFFDIVEESHGGKGTTTGYLAHTSITAALAWAILVESALLNERLIQDMLETQKAKGCPTIPEGGLPFFGPNPPPEARKLFNDYVQARWPIYVFAIDPVTEDQNVADAFSSRRELQLALSLAFASGQIGARSLTRYTRRIEMEIETIAINRTVVGFSHGSNTFGWRFYPRVQTPPIPGNLEVIFLDLLWGRRGPRRDLCHRRLENGPRECVALVVMPSFIPQVNLDISANWFRLAQPSCKELTLTESMRLSKQVKNLRDGLQLICDQGQYREGDVPLMARRLEQLSERLPMQSQLVNVPYENTHGGFELFSSGTTDLAPELIGWYGGVGINPNAETSLFLVGDHFSVHQTRVVAGGMPLSSNLPSLPAPPSTSNPQGAVSTPTKDLQVELLSRQVMRVTIPAGVQPKDGKIDVHVATPYGVSHTLAIPVVGAPPAAAAPTFGYSIQEKFQTIKAAYRMEKQEKTDKYIISLADDVLLDGAMRIDWQDPTGSALNKVKATFAFAIDSKQLFSVTRELTANDGHFDIAKDDLKVFMSEVLKRLQATDGYTPSNLLPSSLQGTVTIIPVGDASHATEERQVPTKLRVELVRTLDPSKKE